MEHQNELISYLQRGIVEVTFTKADGTTRIMKCTLNESLHPPVDIKGTKKHSDAVIPVWDLEKESWRSFRKDSIVTWRSL